MKNTRLAVKPDALHDGPAHRGRHPACFCIAIRRATVPWPAYLIPALLILGVAPLLDPPVTASRLTRSLCVGASFAVTVAVRAAVTSLQGLRDAHRASGNRTAQSLR